jgi:hypothetical protein
LSVENFSGAGLGPAQAQVSRGGDIDRRSFAAPVADQSPIAMQVPARLYAVPVGAAEAGEDGADDRVEVPVERLGLP